MLKNAINIWGGEESKESYHWKFYNTMLKELDDIHYKPLLNPMDNSKWILEKSSQDKVQQYA